MIQMRRKFIVGYFFEKKEKRCRGIYLPGYLELVGGDAAGREHR